MIGTRTAATLLGCLLGVGPATCAGQPPDSGETVLYVSLDGNDGWSGSLSAPNAARTDGPLATMPAARDAVRAAREAGPGKAVRVLVRAGTYHLLETLVLGLQDSGTEAAPVTYEACPDEEVILSGGRPIAGWQKGDGELYYADLPKAQGGKWTFRQLFVNGRREPRARYPNFDASDVLRRGWLYAAPDDDFGLILAGIASQGDFLEYEFEVPADATYHLWLAYATIVDGAQRGIGLAVDGDEVELGYIPASGSWRKTTWAQAADVTLTAGTHRLRVEGRLEAELRVHFDAFVFSDSDALHPTGYELPPPPPGERRAVIQAESAGSRVGGQTGIEVGLRTFVCDGKPTKQSRHKILCPRGAIRPAWVRAPEAEVNIFAAWGWFNEIARVASVDEDRSVITIEGNECQYPIWEGNRFFVENVFEELDEPGEWYLDTQAGRLYYWPRDTPLADSTVVAPVLDRIVHLKADVEGDERVQHITLRGFTFAHSDYTADHKSVRTAQDAAVWLEKAWSCTVEDCVFTNVGGSGIRLHLDCRHNRIAGNTITEAGGNGILLTSAITDRGIVADSREAAANVAPVENVITGNHVHHCGRIHKYVAGVHIDSRPQSMLAAPGNLVSHNLIHDMPRNGIFAFNHQGGNTFQYNRVHTVMQESDDGGGIHVCQDDMDCAPTTIRNNVFHDVFGAKVGSDGSVRRGLGFGIYLDCATSSCRVTSNLVYRTSYGNVFLHGGRENVVENNILVDDAVQNLFVSNYTDRMAGNRFLCNIVANTLQGAEMFGLKRFTDETLAESDQNLFWCGGEPVQFSPFGTLADWQAEGFEAHSLVDDPRFVDAGADDFGLRPESPAFDLGFEPFDTQEAGTETRNPPDETD